MDFMENDNSFFYEEIRNLINKIKESNVIDTPFPHIIIEDGISDNITFDRLRLELPIENPRHGVGRTEYPI